MSIIKERLRQQAAEFISLREVFELLMKDGEGCTLADAAKFLCQVEIIDPVDFLPDFLIYDNVQGFVAKATPEKVQFYWAEIKIIACGVIDDSLRKVKFNCDAVGFERSELISFMGLHGIGIAGVTEQSSQPASDDAQEHLRQLEAENARLVDQVAELQQQLQEATAAAQQAPQPGASTSCSRWPWGSHHTEALGHLEAAGMRCWQWFDPTDPTTAPTNETVIDWLKKERGVSDNLARAMATILRADKLPFGPRR